MKTPSLAGEEIEACDVTGGHEVSSRMSESEVSFDYYYLFLIINTNVGNAASFSCFVSGSKAS